MRHFGRALNTELFKYRKRKQISLGGSVPGVPYAGFARSRRHVSGMPYTPGRPGYHHDIYMSGMPRAYHPSLNASAVQETEYDPYEPMGRPHVSRSSFQPHHLPRSNQQIPGGISVPDDDLALIELLRLTKGEEGPPPRENLEAPFLNGAMPGPINPADGVEPSLHDNSVDTFPSFPEVAKALMQLSKVLPPDHPDLVNLRGAIQEWSGEPDAWSEGAAQPSEAGLYEVTAPAAGPEYGGMMTQELFDQAMGQVAEAQMAPGAEPQPAAPGADMCAEFQQELQPDLEGMVQQAMPQQDAWDIQQQMYDEELLMLMNAYMMPGLFGFGPMGPMGPMPMPPGL